MKNMRGHGGFLRSHGAHRKCGVRCQKRACGSNGSQRGRLARQPRASPAAVHTRDAASFVSGRATFGGKRYGSSDATFDSPLAGLPVRRPSVASAVGRGPGRRRCGPLARLDKGPRHSWTPRIRRACEAQPLSHVCAVSGLAMTEVICGHALAPHCLGFAGDGVAVHTGCNPGAPDSPLLWNILPNKVMAPRPSGVAARGARRLLASFGCS